MKITIKEDRDVQLTGLTRREADIMNSCMCLSTEVWTGYVDDVLACIWGVVPPSFLSNKAYLWLYTTDVVKEHPFVFVRHSQVVMERLLKDYELIIGHCMLDTPHSMRWLKWLGAVFGDPDEHKIPFQIRRKHG